MQVTRVLIRPLSVWSAMNDSPLLRQSARVDLRLTAVVRLCGPERQLLPTPDIELWRRRRMGEWLLAATSKGSYRPVSDIGRPGLLAHKSTHV